jgi:hypothetical protein
MMTLKTPPSFVLVTGTVMLVVMDVTVCTAANCSPQVGVKSIIPINILNGVMKIAPELMISGNSFVRFDRMAASS